MAFKFVQMSDPQLGFYASRHAGIEGIDYEVNNLSSAISMTNDIKPDFVITTGDLIQDRFNSEHVGTVQKLYRELNCPYYFAPGNTDLSNTPEFGDIQRYKKRFGLDHYNFYHNETQFIVLNSCVLFDWSKVPGENAKQITFLEKQLQQGHESKMMHQFILMHHPLFGSEPKENDSERVLPKSQRELILNLVERFKVSAVFTGHWHVNNIVNYKGAQLVTSGPISFSLGKDPSGIRTIEVDGNEIRHEYIPLP